MSVVYYFFDGKLKKQKKRKPIHKLYLNHFYSVNELTNIKKVQKNKEYFYVCENSLELKIKELEEDDVDLNLCKDIKKDNSILLEFEDRQIISLKNYLKNLQSGKKYVNNIIQFYKHLLKSLDLLVSKQLVHNNIDFDSVVVDNYDLPLITDFSLSINVTNPNMDSYIKEFIIDYDPSYLEWPLEFHILAYLLTNKLDSLSSYNIEKIVNDVVEHNEILKTFGSVIVSSYKEEALHYFKKYVNRSYNYILTNILGFYKTWDNYALSMMFLRICIGIHRSIQVNNKFIILFMKLLVSNIHLNPLQRLSLSSTSEQFELVLNSLNPKDYKEVLDNLPI